ncbi:MAG: S8 family serine peptidase [Anaerolineae bacterium]|nr:S8 family serine peptidase [Anaerolineae bacterium]
MRRLYNTLKLGGVIVLLFGVTSVAQGAPPQQEPIVFQGRSGQTKHATKVSEDLRVLREEHRANRNLVFVPGNPLIAVSGNRVVVDAVAANDVDVLRADLEKLGLQDIATFGRIVSGRLPIASIDNLSTLDSLNFIRPAYAITNVGLTTSQGDEAMRADLARTTYNVDGSGIGVGVMSDSYNCQGDAAADVASGDLPTDIVVLEDEAGCFSGSDEGRAMMQLVHDVAPGAHQAFHTGFGGQASFAQGIIDLSDAGVDVIVDDVTNLLEPMFQDGIIAQAVDTVEGQGVAYFSSAGNSARHSYQSEFRDSGVIGQFGGIRHDFDPGPGVDDLQRFTLGRGTTTFILQWEDPFFSVSGSPGAASDLDIHLYTATGSYIGGGTESNIGNDPVELINVTSFRRSTTIQIALELSGGPAPGVVKYIFFGPATNSVNEFDTASSTSFGHPNAAGAEAVGAAFYGDTPEFGVDPPLVESFSSAGSTPIFFDTSGNQLINPELRNKPEIVAPDGTNTTFFVSDIDYDTDSFPNFFGTSAAAPHAAAVAALMLEVNPTLKPVDIYSALESTALDMDDPATTPFDSGFDFGTGYGLIQADLAIQEAVVSPPAISVYLPVVLK